MGKRTRERTRERSWERCQEGSVNNFRHSLGGTDLERTRKDKRRLGKGLGKRTKGRAVGNDWGLDYGGKD